MAKFFGANAPFISTGGKILQRQEDERLIKNDLLQLLLTAPGERVMRPDFGTGIRPYLFEPIDDSGLNILRSNIREAVAKFEPRVTLSEVVIDRDDGNSLIKIKLNGKFNFDQFTKAEFPGQTDLLVELNIPTVKRTKLT